MSQAVFGGTSYAQASKIGADVSKAMAGAGLPSAIVVLAQQADLSGAAKLATKAQKTRYVYEALRAVAAQNQPPLVKALTGMGLQVSAQLYIENAIVVTGGQGKTIARSAVNAMAARPDVALVQTDPRVTFGPEEPTSAAVTTPIGIAWNVTWVNAPKVWAKGFTGQGIVVGDIDTGVQWNHPALIRQYRGWNGGTADHNYNWWDAGPAESPVPVDMNGHGTGTTGTAVGDDGKGNQIGVAPGAKWIACRGLPNPDGTGSLSQILSCLQFMLAPWDLNGNNPDPSKAADVVNNSYGCPACQMPSTPFDNLKAAGIMSIVAAGNDGPLCGSVRLPGGFRSVFTVGASSFASDLIAYFSGRGPRRPALVSPQITAPGQNVPTSYPGNGYTEQDGTSFSAPAVTGAVALLWSGRADLFGNVDASIRALELSTVSRMSLSCGSESFHPNNVYGYGSLNVNAALSEGK